MNKQWLRHHLRKQPLRVRRLLLNERLSSSERQLRIAIQNDPDDYALRSALANLLYGGGRRREALLVWRGSVRRFPGAPNPYFQRATWALGNRDFRQAEKYLRLCLRNDHGYFRETAHFWRAESLFRLGRIREARKELDQVPDGYEEVWFLDYERWGKADLAKCLVSGTGVDGA